jgi:hypothetical protein
MQCIFRSYMENSDWSPLNVFSCRDRNLSHDFSLLINLITSFVTSDWVSRGLDSRSWGASIFLFSVPPPLLFFPHTYRPLTIQTSDFALAIRVASPGSSTLASSGAGVLMLSVPDFTCMYT